jgi:hypothetical protein
MVQDRRSPAPRAPRPLEPPVTKATLSELDVTKIIHNPKLRHDINFDPELHFRPNLDGEKGRRKQDKANQFWNSLLDQLCMFVMDRPAFYEKHGEGDDWCLPSLLKSVKEIIQTLVPVRDRVYLDEGLNVELLMQQFNKGIADLEKLALWLSSVLKSHCAPMRDDWVDEMYNELSRGNQNNDMNELVKGMRSLLSVLEAMKLDVANHQIRCLRPVLIEDTVHFEQRFFFKKIQTGKLDISSAKQWYREAEERRAASRLPTANSSFGEMTLFFEAVSRLILPSVSEKTVPNTFLFDEERIIKLRADMLDVINLEICMRMYEDLERVSRCNSIPYFANQLSQQFAMDEDVAPSMSIHLDFNFNSPPSRPSSLVFSSAGSANSSPRSSLIISSQPTPDATEQKTKARNLYNSLVALLQTSPPASRQASRWQAMAPSLALQIFRFTDAPPELLSTFEEKLASHVSDFSTPLYQEVEKELHEKLVATLAKRVREFKGLSGVSLFSVATGGRAQSPSRGFDSSRDRESSDSSREGREESGIDDVAARLAHLGVLHWRVWGQLAYTNEFENVAMESQAQAEPCFL